MTLKFKQILSLVLFMLLTTTVVNAHALSHLFDDDVSNIEHCKICDEYVLTSHDDISFTVDHLEEFNIQVNEIRIESSVQIIKDFPVITFPTGKYYNKPPPFELV